MGLEDLFVVEDAIPVDVEAHVDAHAPVGTIDPRRQLVDPDERGGATPSRRSILPISTVLAVASVGTVLAVADHGLPRDLVRNVELTVPVEIEARVDPPATGGTILARRLVLDVEEAVEAILSVLAILAVLAVGPVLSVTPGPSVQPVGAIPSILPVGAVLSVDTVSSGLARRDDHLGAVVAADDLLAVGRLLHGAGARSAGERRAAPVGADEPRLPVHFLDLAGLRLGAAQEGERNSDNRDSSLHRHLWVLEYMCSLQALPTGCEKLQS
jgi:hypothetical protein